MEKDERVGDPLVGSLQKQIIVKSDALEILSGSWRVGTGKR